MKPNKKKAKIKSTGETIEVYRLTNGFPTSEFIWCNSHDCKTTYKENQLEFI